MSIYTDEGYESRRDYLTSLADDFGIDEDTVFSIASILGSGEDFDGLITSLEDFSLVNDFNNFNSFFTG
jgi:hypothetical protein